MSSVLCMTAALSSTSDRPVSVLVRLDKEWNVWNAWMLYVYCIIWVVLSLSNRY
jgi:hypothetical protein